MADLSPAAHTAIGGLAGLPQYEQWLRMSEALTWPVLAGFIEVLCLQPTVAIKNALQQRQASTKQPCAAL